MVFKAAEFCGETDELLLFELFAPFVDDTNVLVEPELPFFNDVPDED